VNGVLTCPGERIHRSLEFGHHVAWRKSVQVAPARRRDRLDATGPTPEIGSMLDAILKVVQPVWHRLYHLVQPDKVRRAALRDHDRTVGPRLSFSLRIWMPAGLRKMSVVCQ
jgi:hypothetical protein